MLNRADGQAFIIRRVFSTVKHLTINQIESLGYEIHDNGNIVGKRDKKPLSPMTIGDGYLMVHIVSDGIVNTCKIHRMVANKYIPNPDNKPQVNHKDGNKLNNHVNNLEWLTASENIKHSFATGMSKPPSEWKRVIDTETGHVFRSIRQAAKENGLHPYTLGRYLNGNLNNPTNLQLKK
jgi:hypothetical protein